MTTSKKIVSIIIIAAVLRNVNPIRRIYTAFSPRVVIVSRNYTSLRVADSHDVPARSVPVMIYLRPVFHQPDHLLPFVHIPVHHLDSVFRHPFPQYPVVPCTQETDGKDPVRLCFVRRHLSSLIVSSHKYIIFLPFFVAFILSIIAFFFSSYSFFPFFTGNLFPFRKCCFVN